MQNIFKQSISNQLYNDIFTTYQYINYTSFYKDENERNINKKENQKKIAMIAAGSLGLLTVGMMALNHFDIYQINPENIKFSVVAAISAISINATISNTLDRLKNNRNKRYFDEALNYDQFEKRLVADLKSYGIPVQYKEVSTLKEHNDLKDIWKNSDKKDFIDDVRSKTTEYVKKLMDTYVEPALVESSAKLDQQYIKRMLDGFSEEPVAEIALPSKTKPKKNTP